MKKSILLSVFMLALLLTPSLIFAEQSDVDPTGAQACADISSNLKYGTRDSGGVTSVSILQDFLNTKNYLATQPTGFFGRATFMAVKAFQKDNNISPTGYVGALTRAKIKQIDCTDTASVSSGTSTVFSLATTTPTSTPSVGNSTSTSNAPTAGIVAIEYSKMPKILRPGQTYNVTWSNYDVPAGNYNIFLYNPSNEIAASTADITRSTLLGSVDAQTKKLTFTIPAKMHPNAGYGLYFKNKTDSNAMVSSSRDFEIKSVEAEKAETATPIFVSGTLSLNPSTIATSSVPVTTKSNGTLRTQPVLTFDLKADGGDLAVKTIGVHVNTNGTCCTSYAGIYEGDTLIGNASFLTAAISPTGVDGFFFGNKVASTNLVGSKMQYNYATLLKVPKGTTKTYTVKLDFNNIYSAGIKAVASINQGDIVPISDPLVRSANVNGSVKGNAISVTNN
jgi:peptidoglycan hydrolase-like protein with peptidoglycan-binding domain